MSPASARPARLWSAALGLVAAAAVVLVASAGSAEAARKKKRVAGYNPPYASMVVDAKTGRVLQATNEDALRHPASITKVMTLYMLFEQMERGRFRMDSPLRVSAYAASRPPSKIGVQAGETIEVEDAIKALITKSANDVAVVVAENIAGDEETFAEQMTRRARSLGMNRTVFRNASGLPDREQVTTARDLTILARAIQERFPRHFALFQTRNFEYAGRVHRNHNRLLGRVEGVDGIKTGFTRMSGFNLMTSAKADGRHIVSIVLGGRSGRHRDGIMANLVVAHLPRASTGPQRVMVAQASEDDRSERAERPVRSAAPEPQAPRPAPARVETAALQPPAPVPGQATPVALQPRPQPRPIELAAIRPMNGSAAASAFAPPTQTSLSQQPMRWATGAPPAGAREIRPVAQNANQTAAVQAPRPPASVGAVVQPPASPAQAPAARTIALPQPAAQPASPQPRAADAPRPPANVQFTSSVAKAPERTETTPRSAWIIQLAATDDEDKARNILSSARSRSRAVAEARPFTEPVERGGATLFRARFAGFDDQSEAEGACRELKRSGFSCFATRG